MQNTLVALNAKLAGSCAATRAELEGRKDECAELEGKLRESNKEVTSSLAYEWIVAARQASASRAAVNQSEPSVKWRFSCSSFDRMTRW